MCLQEGFAYNGIRSRVQSSTMKRIAILGPPGPWTKHAERGRVVSRALSSGFVGSGAQSRHRFRPSQTWRPRVISMATEADAGTSACGC